MTMSPDLKALLKFCGKALLKKLRNLCSSDYELTLTALLIFYGKALLKKLRNLCSNDHELTLKALLIFCGRALLKKLSNEEPEPEMKKRTMPVLKLTERFGSIENLIGCLRPLIGTSRVRQQLDKEL
jgi:hypothetical protein